MIEVQCLTGMLNSIPVDPHFMFENHSAMPTIPRQNMDNVSNRRTETIRITIISLSTQLLEANGILISTMRQTRSIYMELKYDPVIV